MNELLEQLKSKVGLGDEQASGAIQTVLAFLKDKLPGPIGDQVGNLLGGGGDEGGEGGGGIGDLADKAKGALGGMFGGGDD